MFLFLLNNIMDNNNNSRLEILKYFLNMQFQLPKEGSNNMHGLGRLAKSSRKLQRSNKNKWTTLSHGGMKFPEEYVQKNVPVIYSSIEVYLPKEAEEIAFLYAKYIGTDYVTNSTFKKNFFNDWRKILGKDHVIQSLELCDFSQMKKYLDDEKEKKKENKPIKTEDDDKQYKIAIVDDKEQTISNYKMEPPGIFIGRGKNPNIGKVKRRIQPEDVIINIGKESQIPIPPEGHKWGKVIHDRMVEWLVSWKDTITGKTKYLWLSQESDLRANNDQKKFDIARKLKKKIKTIRDENEKNMKSTNSKIMQIATAMFFIDKLAIRVGNETGEDSADVVGVTNLRVEHVDLGEKNTITLNFLGKDSVPYTNTTTADDLIYNNVKELLKGKEKGDQVFDMITSNDVNKYLHSFMKDLTAKVFRTFNASSLFQKELKKITNRYNEAEKNLATQKAILDDYLKANAKIGRLLNHQKGIAKGYKKSVDKINDTLDKLKKQLAKARRATKKKTATIEKLKDKIKNYKSKKELVKEMKNISLGTSKQNYLDPRLSVMFMKKHNIPIDKLFTKALQKKFAWAFTVDENYKF